MTNFTEISKRLFYNTSSEINFTVSVPVNKKKKEKTENFNTENNYYQSKWRRYVRRMRYIEVESDFDIESND